MLAIRHFESRLLDLARTGRAPAILHTGRGQEAVPAALSLLRRDADQVTGTHRSLGLALALGVDPEALAREVLGRAGGLHGGRGGAKHLSAPAHGLLATHAIVGAGVPLAAGAALSAKRRGDGGLGVAVTGDGAANQGAVLETLAVAPVLRLPLLLIVENNGFGQTTAARYALAGDGICARARAFGWQAKRLDGSDPVAVWHGLADLMEGVRAAGPPALAEVVVPRLDGYMAADEQTYRPAGDIAAAHAQDPLSSAIFDDLDRPGLQAETAARLDAALARALAAEPAA